MQQVNNHLSGDAKSGVESIGGSLASLCVSSRGSRVAGGNGIGGSLALASELLANEAGDDLDGVGGTVVEVSRVDSGESIGTTTVVLGAESDGRVAARTEVKSSATQLAELLGGIGGIASVLCKRVLISFHSNLSGAARVRAGFEKHVPCAPQSDTEKSAGPALAALAQALC